MISRQPQCYFLFSLVWAVGATVDNEGRVKFDAFLRQLLRKESPDALSAPGAPQPSPPQNFKLARPFPEKGVVFDYVYDPNRGSTWVDWMATVPSYEVPALGSARAPFPPPRLAPAAARALFTPRCVPLLFCRCPPGPSSTTSSCRRWTLCSTATSPTS